MIRRRDVGKRDRWGGATTPVIIVLSLVVVALLVGALGRLGRSGVSGRGSSGDALVLYCAAGVKPPVDAALRRFEAEIGGRISVQYGGSGTLLSQIQISPSGDLYLAADDSYVERARRGGLVAASVPLATIHPVIAVRMGNPKGIRTFADLLRSDVRVAVANPDAAAIGKVSRDILEARGLWSALESHARVFKPTVNAVAVDIVLGTVDAGIVWDSTVVQVEGLEHVDLEMFADAVRSIEVGVLRASRRPADALRLARYLGAADRGGREFDARGYGAVDRELWSEGPGILPLDGIARGIGSGGSRLIGGIGR